MKIIKLISRLIYGVFKLMLKLLGVCMVLSLIVGIKASIVITLILMTLIVLVFINNLFSVLSEGVNHQPRNRIKKSYDHIEDDPWVPGMPAITTKSHISGFFYEDD